jgi:LysR family hydrogen peroxide-inducible transcriptional activator
MNLQDLRYIVAIAGQRHFGRAAQACHVSQPTLSGQVRKLEEQLGVALFERTNKWVFPTEVGERILAHAARVLEEAEAIEEVARAARNPLGGPLRLGVIPTLGPYLTPLILGPLREACPELTPELWEDVTAVLLERLRGRRLDAAIIATEVPEGDLATRTLFAEPFLAALPVAHPLAEAEQVEESALSEDLLVLSDAHCLAGQALAACGRTEPRATSFRAASLETLVNLVAVGYGATLVPQLAARGMRGRGVVLRPLAGGAARTVRLVCRPSFPRMAAIKAVAAVIRRVVGGPRDGRRT